jgi:hopene-associated glycosyltransferase HpnB
MTLLGLALLLLWLYLALGHGQFWRTEPVLAPAPSSPAPAFPEVSIIVPARNEEAVIGTTLASLLAQDYPAFRVILVDDASTDRTRAIAEGFADPRLSVLTAPPKPPRWSGKLWALAHGAAAAETPLLYFTDADIRHAPGHLAALVTELETGHHDMVSEMVRLSCASLAERALIPAFVYFFQLLYPFAWVNDPLRRSAAAAGGSVLIRRSALDRIGGLAALHDALIDDVTLAGRVKRGGRIWLGHTDLAESLRRYEGFGEIWRMIARTAFVQLRHSALLLLLTVLGMALTFLAPPALALWGAGAPRLLGAAASLIMLATYVPSLRRYHLSPLWAFALPLIALFYTAATVGSALDHWRGRGVEWKARHYRESAA